VEGLSVVPVSSESEHGLLQTKELNGGMNTLNELVPTWFKQLALPFRVMRNYTSSHSRIFMANLCKERIGIAW
jgi:hypothetical protein